LSYTPTDAGLQNADAGLKRLRRTRGPPPSGYARAMGTLQGSSASGRVRVYH